MFKLICVSVWLDALFVSVCLHPACQEVNIYFCDCITFAIFITYFACVCQSL